MACNQAANTIKKQIKHVIMRFREGKMGGVLHYLRGMRLRKKINEKLGHHMTDNKPQPHGRFKH